MVGFRKCQFHLIGYITNLSTRMGKKVEHIDIPDKGSFTYYITQRRWVGGLQNVTIPMQLEKFYYAKALLELSRWSKRSEKNTLCNM